MSAATARASVHGTALPILTNSPLFANEADMADSKNQGFTVLGCRRRCMQGKASGKVMDYTAGSANADVPDGIRKIIQTVINDYSYML